jgi:hypothetical protein
MSSSAENFCLTSRIERHAKKKQHGVPSHSRPVQAGLIDLQSQAPFHEMPRVVCRHSLRVGPIPHVLKKMCPDVSASDSITVQLYYMLCVIHF